MPRDAQRNREPHRKILLGILRIYKPLILELTITTTHSGPSIRATISGSLQPAHLILLARNLKVFEECISQRKEPILPLAS